MKTTKHFSDYAHQITEDMELKNLTGGSHCPSYHLKHNYDGMSDNGAFLAGFLRGLLNI
ncbi:MAG: hypothetical protein PHH93_06635 [Prolixibacteraceae bacterium]|nr:hypothetical protein [Prolixibacteraceae bacterium]